MDVRMPDGTIVRNVPEGVTRAQLQARLTKAAPETVAVVRDPRSLSGVVSPTKRVAKTSRLTSALAGAVDTGMFGFGDEIAAGITGGLDTVIGDPLRGRVPSLSRNYDARLAPYRADTKAAEASHPGYYTGGQIAGAVLSPVPGGLAIRAGVKGLSVGAKLVRAGLQGAAQGAAYGFGSGEGGAGERLANAGREGVSGGAGGVVGTATGGVLGRVLKPVVREPVRKLREAGVRGLTVGQIAGGGVKRFEDAIATVPVVGEMVGNAQRGAIESFNRAGFDRALSPLGVKLPKDLSAQDSHRFAQQVFDTAYSRARVGLTFSPDEIFLREAKAVLDAAANPGMRSLDTGHAVKLKGIYDEALRAVNPGTGRMNGDGITKLLSDMRQMAAKRVAGNNPFSESDFGHAIGELADTFEDAAARHSKPEAVALRNAANEGYAILTRLEDAASRSGSRAGRITPEQLSAAVRRGDKTARKRAYNRGDALLQKLSDAGKDVLPSSVPSSGTTERAAALGLLGVGGMTFSAPGAVTAGLLNIPYLPGVRRGVEAALIGARPKIVEKAGTGIKKHAGLLGKAGTGLAISSGGKRS